MTRCGFATIIGRPNVGKSTLLNRLIGQKISITSRKPQTTRFHILGVCSKPDTQIIFVDTPGLHRDIPKAMNRYMNKEALNALHGVNIILFLIDARQWHDEDEWILEKLKKAELPVVLVLNKVDKMSEKGDLLPLIDTLRQKYHFVDIIPISAKSGENLEALMKGVEAHLPQADFLYPADQITDRSERFLVQEIIREKVIRNTGAEVPYAMTIEIEEYKSEKNLTRISAIIWVEKSGQKAIIIGEGGARLKTIGTAARLDIETLINQKVFLRLWCKVKENWSDDERALKSLGYYDRL